MNRKIVIASHGKLASGIADTAQMILGGCADDFQVFELLPGGAATDFAEAVESQVKKNPDTEFVILTDIYQASVCTAMSALVKYPNVKVFAGMNLNLLFLVCTEYEEGISEENVEQLLQEARGGIRFIRPQMSETEEDDF